MKSFFLRRLASCCFSHEDDFNSNPSSSKINRGNSLNLPERKIELKSNDEPYREYETPNIKVSRFIDKDPNTPDTAPLNAKKPNRKSRGHLTKSKSESRVIKNIRPNLDSAVIIQNDDPVLPKPIRGILKKNKT